MKNQVLIGESGGSKTDWALVKDGKIHLRFSSLSLHPKNWNSQLFIDLLELFESKNIEFAATNLAFFGAGCNKFEKSLELTQYFSSFGFTKIEISGDLIAACLATLGNNDGYTAILGSGSVLIEYKNKAVSNYFGGLGRELGDEGAGYFFGKLVLSAYLDGELESIQKSILKSVLSITESVQLDRKEIEDSLCLQLGERLGGNLFEFQNFHMENIDLFYSKYVRPNLDKGSTINFVGSYAFFHQEIIKSYFRAKGYVVGQIIARPIEKLIELFQK